MLLKCLEKMSKMPLFILLFFCIPFTSSAWGVIGHRVVGEIASVYLTPKAKTEVQKILGTETVALASVWADFIKSDTSFKYLNVWHYIDVEKGLDHSGMKDALQKDTTANAYTKMIFLIRQLKNKKLSQPEKQMYLRLLIHIIGDVHQPFHVSATGDRGGNDIKVLWFNGNSNIHRVWDEQLIEFQQLSYTEYTKAINFTTAKQRSDWQKEPISKWFFDSYKISEELHKELIKPDQKLGFQYNFDHVQTLNQQLLKGGIHLAGILNQIFL